MLFLNGISSGTKWLGYGLVFIMLFGAIVALILLFRELEEQISAVAIEIVPLQKLRSFGTHSFIFGAGMFGSLYIIPVLVQTIQGFSAFKAGLMLLPGVLFR